MPIVTTSDPRDAALALAAGRGPVIAIRVHDAHDDMAACVRAVLAHTPADAAVLLLDDGSAHPRLGELAGAVGEAVHRVVVLRHGEALGRVRSANRAFELAGRRDVVLLHVDVVVAPGWLERLREAAYSDTRIATATPLTNRGAILSVPERNRPGGMPAGVDVEQAAAAVACESRRLRPRIPNGLGHCMYVRRMALDVVGGFADAVSRGNGEEIEFGQRCVQAGLAHVCADDVFVFHREGGDLGGRDPTSAPHETHERELATRYPYYRPWLWVTADRETTPLACALAIARRALAPLTVAFDATALSPRMVGTQRVAVEVARALAQQRDVGEVIVVTPPGPRPAYLERAIAALPSARLVADDPSLRLGADVAYRPVQVGLVEEVERLRRLAPRCVVHQLDLIAYNNPAYFPTWREWAGCRDGARFSLAAADGIAFLTAHAEADARAEGLVPAGTPTRITLTGIDHFAPDLPESVPPGVPVDLPNLGFVLCFGTDFRHKNRVFALRVFAAMCARGYRGMLVLAGPRMVIGSSGPDEATFLGRHPTVAERVVRLAEVSEEERLWLYRHAQLVLCPTLYEGFGLVPFEVALLGTPCLSSRMASLDEVLPAGIETITDWNPDGVAEQALGVLADPARRAALVDALATQAREFTWARTAGRLVELFHEVCRAAPRTRVRAVDGEGGVVPRSMACSPERSMLDGMYPREVYEILRAVGQRERLRRPLAALAAWAYRTASAARSRLRRADHQGPT